MLVLTRKKDQSIMIGDEIEIVIVDISEYQVKIGISAPKNVPIFRKEIYLEIKRENIEAAGIERIPVNIFDKKNEKNIKVNTENAEKDSGKEL